jgi:hypothetical protein
MIKEYPDHVTTAPVYSIQQRCPPIQVVRFVDILNTPSYLQNDFGSFVMRFTNRIAKRCFIVSSNVEMAVFRLLLEQPKCSFKLNKVERAIANDYGELVGSIDCAANKGPVGYVLGRFPPCVLRSSLEM